MLDQLTSVQLSEWEAYDTIDPIGTWREDYRTAALQALIVNMIHALYPKEGSDPIVSSATDFMPIWDKALRKKVETKKPKQSVDEMMNLLMSLADTQNKKEARKEAIKKHKPPNT